MFISILVYIFNFRYLNYSKYKSSSEMSPLCFFSFSIDLFLRLFTSFFGSWACLTGSLCCFSLSGSLLIIPSRSSFNSSLSNFPPLKVLTIPLIGWGWFWIGCWGGWIAFWWWWWEWWMGFGWSSVSFFISCLDGVWRPDWMSVGGAWEKIPFEKICSAVKGLNFGSIEFKN